MKKFLKNQTKRLNKSTVNKGIDDAVGSMLLYGIVAVGLVVLRVVVPEEEQK